MHQAHAAPPVPFPASSFRSTSSDPESVKIPITGIPLAQYPASVRSLGTGIGDEIDYDTLSVMDSGDVAMPPIDTGMAAGASAAAAGAAAAAPSHSSGFRSKMGNLFRKRSPRIPATREADGLGIARSDIPTSLSSSADAHSYVSANNGIPYATSRRSAAPSLSPSKRSTRSRSGPGASVMMAQAAGPEALATQRLYWVLRQVTDVLRAGARKSFILRPIDAIADTVPALEPTVVIIEMVMLMWLLYELSIVLEVVTAATKTVCRPAIMVGRMLGFGFKSK